MISAVYSANIKWLGEDIEKYFSQDWPVTPKDLNALVARVAEIEETGQDISVASLRYFWRYEDHLWRSYGLTIEEIKSRTKLKLSIGYEQELKGSSWILRCHNGGRTFQWVPNQEKELKVPIDFEKESEYIVHFVDAINALHRLCFICLHEHNTPIDSTAERVRYLFDVLHAAEVCRTAFWNMEESAARSIDKDARILEIKTNASSARRSLNDLYAAGGDIALRLEKFPFLKEFSMFQTEFGESYKQRYGGFIKFNNPVQRYEQYYWHQPECSTELMNEFMNSFNMKSQDSAYTEESFTQFVLDFKTKSVQFINSLINRYINILTMEFDFSKHCLTLNARHWPDALLAKLVAELQGDKKYASCVICHKAFSIDSSHNQKYCLDCLPRARSFQMRTKRKRDQLKAANQIEK